MNFISIIVGDYNIYPWDIIMNVGWAINIPHTVWQRAFYCICHTYNHNTAGNSVCQLLQTDLAAVEGEREEIVWGPAVHNTGQSSEPLLIQSIVLRANTQWQPFAYNMNLYYLYYTVCTNTHLLHAHHHVYTLWYVAAPYLVGYP